MLKKYCFVNWIKAIACLLIIHFHSDILFPGWLSKVSFGGDIGNNLFFMTSGFLMASSVERSYGTISFYKWYLKHLLAIIPMWWIAAIVSIVFGVYQIDSIIDLFQYFVFPGMFWFIGALVVFYPLFYFIQIKVKDERILYCILAVILVLHLLFDGLTAERYFVGFAAMVIGAMVYHIREKLESNENHNLCLCLVAFIIYILLHFVKMQQSAILISVVHVFTGITTLLIGLFLMCFGIKNEKNIKEFTVNHKIIDWLVLTLSSITLASYIVQSFDKRLIFVFCGDVLRFPFSLILSYFAIIIVSCLITTIDRWLRTRVSSWNKNRSQK